MCTPERTAHDRCPGVLVLHEALDGGLARIRLPGGRLAVASLDALRRAAELGSGLVELTARGNVQLRGLAADSVPEIAEILTAGGLLPSTDHDGVRNIVGCPLADEEADAVVTALDRELCADAMFAALPGRFLFAVDDGSGMTAWSGADVTLAADRDGRFVVELGGWATDWRVDAGEAPAAALAAARAFLAVRGDGEAWRISELAGGAAAVAATVGCELTGPELQPGPRAPAAGVHADLDAVTALVPLGRLDASSLPGLAELAGDLRVSRARTITLRGVQPGRMSAVLAGLERLGLVADPDSGWAGLSACVGIGACAKARGDVRAAAQARAAVRLPGAPVEHWSGCERRCGEPREAAVSVVAGEENLDAALARLGGGR